MSQRTGSRPPRPSSSRFWSPIRADRAMTRRTTARRDRRASRITTTSKTPATTAAMSDGVRFTSPTIRRRSRRLANGRGPSVLLDRGQGVPGALRLLLGVLELARGDEELAQLLVPGAGYLQQQRRNSPWWSPFQ